MSISATDIVAFGVVELGVQLPIDDLYKMSPTDPLYAALVKAWKSRERRIDQRNAMLCCIVANCAGNKTSIRDFMPPEPVSREEQEAVIKANFIKYATLQQGGLVH